MNDSMQTQQFDIDRFRILAELLLPDWLMNNDPELPDDLRKSHFAISAVLAVMDSEPELALSTREMLISELEFIIPDLDAQHYLMRRRDVHREEIAEMIALVYQGYQVKAVDGGFFDIVQELRDAIALSKEMRCPFSERVAA